MCYAKCNKQTDTGNEMEEKDSRGKDRVKDNSAMCGSIKYVVSTSSKFNPFKAHFYSFKQR